MGRARQCNYSRENQLQLSLCDFGDVLFARDLPDSSLLFKSARPDAGPGLLLVHANPVHIPYV